MATTKRYLHLAGTVFRDEADALERRLLGAELSTKRSTNLRAPSGIQHHGGMRVCASADRQVETFFFSPKPHEYCV
jgi:hypothetical protein